MQHAPPNPSAEETDTMNAPAQKPQTLAEQVESRRAELDAMIASLDKDIDALKDKRRAYRAELDALPVARRRRKGAAE